MTRGRDPYISFSQFRDFVDGAFNVRKGQGASHTTRSATLPKATRSMPDRLQRFIILFALGTDHRFDDLFARRLDFFRPRLSKMAAAFGQVVALGSALVRLAGHHQNRARRQT